MQIQKSLDGTHVIVFDDNLNTFIFKIDGDEVRDDIIAKDLIVPNYDAAKLAAEKFLNDGIEDAPIMGDARTR